MKRLTAVALMVMLCAPLLTLRTANAQEQDEVRRLMDRMSAAAKVGQLFLVTFPGAEVTDSAAIYELICEHHVGGVALRPQNGNIANDADTPSQVAALVGQLQQTAWTATRPVTETLVPERPSPDPFVPLFVAVSQEGDGMPFTSIVSGTTPLPSEMALGATWNLSHTETVGRIVGQELSALGVNMLLGPSLDVLESPRRESAGDLGVRAFGGEPFWVGQMGLAYIRGVHEGGEGRVAVVAKHFPGLGASDRSLEEEVSTVQRTLEKLRQIDLAPFFTVTQAEHRAGRPDALTVSHIRFRGLEGGRFVTTRPVSVDSQVLDRLLGLPELKGWREAGGVTVSDGLGVRALRRFYDPSEESFNSRRIAQEAFLAGNDLLLVSQFALSGDWKDQIANVKSTIAFFCDKYESDPAFQTLVDAAVARILRLKLSLYGGTFSLGTTQPEVEAVREQVGQDLEAVSAVARDAVTLLSPPSADLVPSPPTPDDSIVIFTDGRTGRPCAGCASVPYIDPVALEDTIARLYGPGATGQVDPKLLSSFTFDQLGEYLSVPPRPPTPTAVAGEEVTATVSTPVEAALQTADWVIFAMLDPTEDAGQSGAVQRFLGERADALGDTNLVVLAYDAPYYLDATEVSKLSAYYVAYSRPEPFIEASVRALFGEFVPAGAPPVSVSGVNYDLLTQTSPDPEQTIAVYSREPTEEGQPTPEPPQLEVGDELQLRTGVILDHNGNLVPDGTPVHFIFTYPQEGLEHTAMETTHAGVARTSLILERTGQLEVSIQADPAPRRIALQVTIQEGEPATIVTPTPRPTPVPTPTLTPEVEPTVEEKTPSPTRTPVSASEGEEPPTTGATGAVELALALAAVAIVGSSGYYAMRLGNRPMGRALRAALWCVIGGLLVYVAYALPVPGIAWLREEGGLWVAGSAPLVGGAVPLVVMWILGLWDRR